LLQKIDELEERAEDLATCLADHGGVVEEGSAAERCAADR